MDATTKILQVPKEEMEEETQVLGVPREQMEQEERLENKILHITCSSEEGACDLLMEGCCFAFHKKRHHFALQPEKDKTKSKTKV